MNIANSVDTDPPQIKICRCQLMQDRVDEVHTLGPYLSDRNPAIGVPPKRKKMAMLPSQEIVDSDSEDRRFVW